MSAVVNGVAFNPTSASFTPFGTNSVTLEGWNTTTVSDRRSVSFTVTLPPTTPQSVNVSTGQIWMPDPVEPQFRTVWHVRSGTCTFTSITGARLKGSFSFTGEHSSYGDVEVKSGTFDVCQDVQCQ